MALAAIIISVFAALFTGLQWKEARQTRIDDETRFQLAREDAKKSAAEQQAQVDRSAESAERSAKSSEKSNDVAIKSLELNQQMFQTSERAFVHVKEIDFLVRAGQPLKATIVFENVGKTPAKRILPYFILVYRGSVLSEIPKSDLAEARSSGTPVELVNGDHVNLDAVANGGPLTNDEVNYLSAGTGRVYAYGVIRYRDIFQIPRETDFWVEFKPPNQDQACPFFNSVQ